MQILKQAFSKIKKVHKKQQDFFMILIQGLIEIAGKRNFRNLARYIQMAEHTFTRQMAKTFNFIELNTQLISELKKDGDILIGAQDGSFIPKSGKKTYGKDFFWNGCNGRAENGLEITVIAVVKVNGKKDGFTISAEQVPANPVPLRERKKWNQSDFSRMDFYLLHVEKARQELIGLGVTHMVVDAFFAKNKYVNGVVNLGLHVVSKMRKDARLRRPYSGLQKARGRKKKFDTGKIETSDFKDSFIMQTADGVIELTSCIAHSVSLDRLIKVVRARKKINDEKYSEALLFSTDLEQDMLQIYEFYVSRFQIEFIFRDAKCFTGLGDCQSRDEHRLNFHFNACLTALNVVKIQDAETQKTKGVQHAFSMTSWMRKYHVEIVLNRFFSMFDLDPTCFKLNPKFEKLLGMGNIHV